MIDDDDRYRPLKEAADWFPGRNGKKVALATIYRWSLSGARGGIKLQTWQVGSVRCTTARAVHEFVAALTAARDGQPAVDRAPAKRTAATAAALDKIGI